MFRPVYTITDRILLYSNEIAVAYDYIQRARLVPKWEVSLRKEALVQSAYSSTHIEGNALSLEEVSLLALGRSVSAIRKDKQEVLNYLEVLSGLESIAGQQKVTKRHILRIHRRLVKNTLAQARDEGVYRNRQVVIGHRNAEGKTVVTFRPPKTPQVPKLVQEFLDWLNAPVVQKVHPVLIVGITHYEIARIHPFVDGNGRLARVMATLVLVRKGFDVKRFFALDDYYDSDRKSYYEALRSVDPKTRDLTQWLEYFCEGVAFAVHRVREKVLLLSKDKIATGFLAQVALTPRQMQIVEIIHQQGKVTSKDLQKQFRITPQSVHKEMKKLVALHVVQLVGKGRGAHYILC